jgi:hypothetical protein
LLGQQQVTELAGVAQEGELVLAASGRCESRLDFAGVRKPQPRLAQEIEADVGLRDVLLEDRAVTDPLAEALREYERRVAEAQQVLENGVRDEFSSNRRSWVRDEYGLVRESIA